MKSTYSLPSTSKRRDPLARSAKKGATPNGSWVTLLENVCAPSGMRLRVVASCRSELPYLDDIALIFLRWSGKAPRKFCSRTMRHSKSECPKAAAPSCLLVSNFLAYVAAMRKRVIILAKFFPPERGGMETYALALANALKNDFDVHVLVHARETFGSDEAWDGFRVRRCGTWMSALSQPFSPSMLVEVPRLKPDIVHLNAPNAFANLCWALTARDTKLVITHHADVSGRAIAKRFYTPLYRRSVPASRNVVVFSRKNARLSVDLPQIDEKLVEIPHGMDPELWQIDDDLLREAAALRQQLAGGSPVASFIGRLIGYKGLDVLVRAIAQIADGHAFIVGQGPLRGGLEELAHGIGAGDRIHFLGGVDERTKRIVLLASDLLRSQALARRKPSALFKSRRN